MSLLLRRSTAASATSGRSVSMIETKSHSGDWRATMVQSAKATQMKKLASASDELDQDEQRRLERQYHAIKLKLMADNDNVDRPTSSDDDSDSEDDDNLSPLSSSRKGSVGPGRSSSRGSARMSGMVLASEEAEKALFELRTKLTNVERSLTEKSLMKQTDIEGIINYEMARRLAVKEKEWEEKQKATEQKLSTMESRIEAEVQRRLSEAVNRQSSEDRPSGPLKRMTTRLRISFQKKVDKNNSMDFRDSESTVTTVDSDITDSCTSSFKLESNNLVGTMAAHPVDDETTKRLQYLEEQVEAQKRDLELAQELLLRAMDYQDDMEEYVEYSAQRMQDLDEDRRNALHRVIQLTDENEALTKALGLPPRLPVTVEYL